MSPTIIALIITACMAVLLASGKFPFGLVSMASALALIVTGVLDIPTAMSGFGNNTVVIIAAMFCMSAALQKTNVPYVLSNLMHKVDGKNDMLLVLATYVVIMLMGIFLPFMVNVVLIAAVLQTFPKESEVKVSRMLLPLLMIGLLWEKTLPVNMGATVDFTSNIYVENIVTDPGQLLQIGNIFTVKIIPVVVTVIYALFIWKRLPKAELTLDQEQVREVAKCSLPKWQENLIYVLFVIVFIVLIFNSYFGSLMFVIPGVCVIILGFTGVMNKNEIVSNVACDSVWMLVGVQAVTNALTNTGATGLIGNALLPLVQWTDNGFFILLIISVFTTVMTTFLSNTGTMAVLTPLVASVAMAAGMDPRAMMITVAICSNFAFCFPSGSPNCALVYGMGQYNPFKMLKYNAPLLIILVVVTAASANMFFPLF